jgi:hypothetical protein
MGKIYAKPGQRGCHRRRRHVREILIAAEIPMGAEPPFSVDPLLQPDGIWIGLCHSDGI